jgi:hypothetical protein
MFTGRLDLLRPGYQSRCGWLYPLRNPILLPPNSLDPCPSHASFTRLTQTEASGRRLVTDPVTQIPVGSDLQTY